MQVQITNFCKNIKIKKQFLFLGSILLFFFNVNNIWAETKYSMTLIKNCNSPSGTTEFSIYIHSRKNNFTLTSYQCAIRLGKIEQSAYMIFQYVPGSSELENEPNLYVGIDNIDGEKELTFVSYVGNDKLTSKKKLVGKFILEGIEEDSFNPIWNFDGVISTIITGNDFNNITATSNHSINRTEVLNDKNDIPLNFQISQNYPNPFNLETKVEIEMREEGNVSLLVYNLLGEKLNYIFGEFLGVGVHEININADNLTSGIYIYQLQVDNRFSSFRKMNLIK
ncbi:MAG: T9SS type A sorting domain-containing protein [Ignavibacteriae bacterium]|nr:T9SS type A sorting domain-containing protein [Ignavibacteriota bacterium]